MGQLSNQILALCLSQAGDLHPVEVGKRNDPCKLGEIPMYKQYLIDVTIKKGQVGMEDVAKIVAWLGAAVFVFAYLILLILQFCHLDSTGLEWNRRLELLNPLQSLAFAGAGVLLGTAVQKQATKDATDRADRNEAAATKGAKLAEEVLEEASSSRAPKAIKDLVPTAKEVAGTSDP